MERQSNKQTNPRRTFLSTIAAGAAGLGLATLAPLQIHAASPAADMYKDTYDPADSDEWFKKVKGKHRIIYDATKPHEIFPFAWPKVFLLTNQATGTPAKDCGVVVILRHTAIGYAFEDRIWEKYHLGEVFKADDPKTKAPSFRNPFWQPKPGDFMLPGIGEVHIGINELQADGVMFCVCNMAISVFTGVVAQQMNLKADDVKKDWLSSLIPGIQVVPSGVWAVGRAQEHGCAYCFAG